MQTYSLYEKKECKVTPNKKTVRLDCYTVGNSAPSVLILPGGAYSMVSDFNEGKPFAEYFQAHGYNAFVLWYRVGAAARYPAPMEDVARAMQFIRSHAADWKLDSTKIALMGSSAGGHLAGFFAAEYARFDGEYNGAVYGIKPSAVVLCYPVVTMGKLTHAVSRRRLLGLFSGRTEQNAASVENRVTENYPPTFVWHNKDDRSVPYENSVMLKNALDEKGVRCELHLYERGGHGIGLAEGTDAAGWIDDAFAFLQSVFTA